ncbi:MAG: ATP-binding cassette domain-containing protein, partial [Phycisphaerales bacterium]|nr:ATP-binding cassette domain-containing protein [Phycisphaerales bacterium]
MKPTPLMEEGELRCILGPNGCGKTTLFNLISGRYKPTSGRVFFNGQDITGKAVHLIGRAGIGRKFQIPSVFGSLTLEENLRVSLFSAKRPSLFTSNSSFGKGREKITGLLELLGLSDKAKDRAENLSHGERQWLEIGMVLASRPRLMLLDEPTAGMTAVETSGTARLIRKISK